MFVNIKNTSQYLIYLECIADLMDKNTLNEKDKELLDILKKEVTKFELKEINKYCASKVLIQNFSKNIWHLN
jgi:hypothetical protein